MSISLCYGGRKRTVCQQGVWGQDQAQRLGHTVTCPGILQAPWVVG